tara:strand:+ start:152 stop:505 length:354 start_codon:yes stop_codon:yes gene_type:complete
MRNKNYIKKICFDLDGTLCETIKGNYHKSIPIVEAINKVNTLYEQNYYIIIFTARYMGIENANIEKVYKKGYDFTFNQCVSWSLKFNKLILGKPEYDIIIDDKHFNYDNSWIFKKNL